MKMKYDLSQHLLFRCKFSPIKHTCLYGLGSWFGTEYAVNVVCEGVSLDQAKKSRGSELVSGAAPMPREMSFPLGASENWNDVYDYIRCL